MKKETWFKALALVLLFGINMTACSGGDRWKEEALQHDGSTVMVERYQTYGGMGEIGQSAPVKEHTITFSLPGSSEKISWTSPYSQEFGRTNFNVLALHIKDGTPYVIAEPNLCLSYNKWGRPNPPYVIFKYHNKTWQRIQLAELPIEFKTINLVAVSKPYWKIEKVEKKQGYMTPEDIQARNREGNLKTLKQYQELLREPLPPKSSGVACEVMVHYKCGWTSPGEAGRKMMDMLCKH